MKKVIAFSMAALMALSLIACGGDTKSSTSAETSITTSAETSNDSSAVTSSDNTLSTEPVVDEIPEEKPANRDWEGIYILEGDYSDEYMSPSQITEYVFIKLEEGEKISVSIINKDGKINYLPKETEYDGRQLADGENIKAGTAKEDGKVSLELFKKHEWDRDYLTVSVNVLDASNNVVSTRNYKKNEIKNLNKPEGYEDKDHLNLFDPALSDNSGYFTPASDNFGLAYQAMGSGKVFLNGKSVAVGKYDKYTLYDLDGNNACFAGKAKLVFNSAEDADNYFVYITDSLSKMYSTDYLEPVKDGNIIYYKSSASTWGYNSLSRLQGDYTFYYGCKYVYPLYGGEVDQNTTLCYYLNKPLTKEEYSQVSCYNTDYVDGNLLWGAGCYNCSDADCNSSLSIYAFDPNISIFRSEVMSGSANAIRYYDNSAAGIWYRMNNTVIKCFETDGNTVKISEYTYDVLAPDAYNMGITFDNYKNIEASKVTTHIYDMNQEIN